MTKADVVECFRTATSEVAETMEKITKVINGPSNTEPVAGLILQLTDRLLQASEMEAQDRRVVGAVAGAPILRGVN